MLENLVSFFATLLLTVGGFTPSLPFQNNSENNVSEESSALGEPETELDNFEIEAFDKESKKLMAEEIKKEKIRQEKEGIVTHTESQGSSEGQSTDSGLGSDGVSSNEVEAEEQETKDTEEADDIEEEETQSLNQNSIKVEDVSQINIEKTIKNVTNFSID